MTPRPIPERHNPRHPPAQPPRWTREQIRNARQTPILPLLQARNLDLIEHGAGNFEPAPYPGLLFKENYWRWPDRDQSGNAIDFLTQILGLTFSQAMAEITAHQADSAPNPSHES